jgi:hypothetical protein
MTRLLAYLRSLLVSQVYVVLDGSHCVGVRGRLQGAELLRADHARAIGQRIGGSEEYKRLFERQAYDRQRVECHELRDV